MAGPAKRLNAKTVETIKTPGRHADGSNLYLNVTAGGGRSWVFMWTRNGRQREMGLGSARDVSLAEARDLALAHRRSIRDGLDPLEARKAETTKPTFGAFAETFITGMESAWRNTKHKAQWRSTLKTYAASLTDKPVDTIGTVDVLECLTPIWTSKPETASRVRGRIESVLNAAKAKGLRSGDNPAAWVGHLKALLPARSKLSRGHHAAMAIDDLPAFMARLRESEGVAPMALEFTILTAARSGETIGARWSEIDASAKTWTVPPQRMKAGKEHRVPLSDQALEVLEKLRPLRTKGDFIFPGARSGAPLSNMALAMAARRLGESATIHGFRSTFRDWASERTGFPHEVCEMALAHAISNKAEAAYRRGDLFEKRRALMAAWAKFTSGKALSVIPLKRQGGTGK